MKEGDDPGACYCRVCGIWSVPPYPGYYRDAVCSKACFDEWQWRDTLHIVRKPYYPQQPKEPILKADKH